MRTPESLRLGVNQDDPRRQRGASLVVVLILLLVVTVLGLAAIRTTLLQERMSSNLFDRSLSFQAAETALREAQVAIQDGMLSTSDPASISGVVNCDPDTLPSGTACASTPPANATWISATSASTSPLGPGTPQYYVEYMGKFTYDDYYSQGRSANSAQYSAPGAGGPLRHYFRVTARSHNPTDSNRAVVVLQSNFVIK